MDPVEAGREFLIAARDQTPETVLRQAHEEIERLTLDGFSLPGSEAYAKFLSGFVGLAQFGRVPSRYYAQHVEPYRELFEAWQAQGRALDPRVWEALAEMEAGST